MRHAGIFVRFLGLAAVVGCSDSGGKQSGGTAEQSFLCFDYGSSCSCEVRPPCLDEGRCDVASSGTEVSVCELYECCLSNEDSEGSPICECFNDGPACEAQAASMPGSKVVSECPVGGGKAPAGECADIGQNCTDGYLSQEELVGCCEGSICDVNNAGVLTCRKADAEDQMLAKECERTARNIGEIDSPKQALVGSIETSKGTLPVDTIDFLFSSFGKTACLASFDLTLSSSTGDCSLDLSAGPRVDEQGSLIITRISISGNDCGIGSFIALADDEDAIDGRLTFDGVTCDGGLIYESYCAQGRYEMAIGGTLEDLTFDAPFVIEGALCGDPDAENAGCDALRGAPR